MTDEKGHLPRHKPARLLVLMGLALLGVSLIGIVLAAGTLLTAGSIQAELVNRLRQEQVLALSRAGLPGEIVDRFKFEELISQATRAALSPEQQTSLREAERLLTSLGTAASEAAAKARRKSMIGGGACVLGALAGALLAARGRRGPPALRGR